MTYRKALYDAILFRWNLNSRLSGIGRQAENIFSPLVKQMAQQEDITAQLKAARQIHWGGLMNCCKFPTEEIFGGDNINIKNGTGLFTKPAPFLLHAWLHELFCKQPQFLRRFFHSS